MSFHAQAGKQPANRAGELSGVWIDAEMLLGEHAEIIFSSPPLEGESVSHVSVLMPGFDGLFDVVDAMTSLAAVIATRASVSGEKDNLVSRKMAGTVFVEAIASCCAATGTAVCCKGGFRGNPLKSTFPHQSRKAIASSICASVKLQLTIFRCPGNVACGSFKNTRRNSGPRRSTTFVSSGA